ncbi:MAG: hypothetical protein QOI31_445 [Solirubrobacterales bacterium]|nr:hypothetical protein [Solirubrobacterales bacterium]
MRRKSIAGGGALVAVLALVPFATAGGGRTVETHQFNAGGDTVTTSFAKCEDGSQVSGGGHSITPTASNDISTRIKALFPTGLKMLVSIDSLQPANHFATSYAICRKGHKLDTVSKVEPIDGSSDQWPSVTAKCPKGTSVTGGGGSLTGSHNDTFILESRPKGDRGWYLKTFVSLTHVGEQRAYAICDSDESNKYETAKKTSTAVDARRAQRGVVTQVTAEAKCPKGSATSGGGYAGPDDPNRAVIENRPKGKRIWLGRVRTYHPEEGFTSYARCLVG